MGRGAGRPGTCRLERNLSWRCRKQRLPAYLEARSPQPEWATAFAQNPQGEGIQVQTWDEFFALHHPCPGVRRGSSCAPEAHAAHANVWAFRRAYALPGAVAVQRVFWSGFLFRASVQTLRLHLSRSCSKAAPGCSGTAAGVSPSFLIGSGAFLLLTVLFCVTVRCRSRTCVRKHRDALIVSEGVCGAICCRWFPVDGECSGLSGWSPLVCPLLCCVPFA